MANQSASDLVLDVQRVGSAAVVHLRGSAGMSEADQLKTHLEKLVDEAVALIVLELSEMDFICSNSLGAIISAHVRSRHHNGQIRLVNPQPPVLRLLETTRLTSLLPIFPSLDQALVS